MAAIQSLWSTSNASADSAL